MKGKPLYPFGIIAVVGLILMFSLSFIGAYQKEERLASEGEVEQPAGDTVDTSDPVALGEQVYQRSCVGCHGGNFEGMGVNFAGIADRYTKDEVISIILEGIPGTNMPGGLASPEEAEALSEYLFEVAN